MSKVLHRSLEAKLAALNGPEWESSDDEAAVTETKTKQTKSKKGSKNKKDKENQKNQLNNDNETNDDNDDESSSVIYVGHIPPAFEEVQILKFFSQFGRITNVKLSRAKRTGNPRGYAFIKFDDKEVASIVADTMSGYILMGERRLVCHVVPKDKIHPKLFQGAKRNLQLAQNDVPSSEKIEYWQNKEREAVNKDRSMEGIKKITQKLLSRERKKREQLKALGIDYDFPGYKASAARVNGAVTEEKPKEEKKKRKVSLDAEDRSDSNQSPSKKAKTKKGNITLETPTKSVKKNQKVETEVKKKKKTKTTKKRRKSV